VHVLDTHAQALIRGFDERAIARDAFRAALERGERLPNPDPLLPLVRTVRLVRSGSERFEATIEDHVLGEVFTGRVRDLAAALELARERWALRWPEGLDLGLFLGEPSEGGR
jgi:hypothetical protein